MLRVLKGLEQPYPPRFGRGSLGSAEEIRHSLIALVSAIGFPSVVAASSWANDIIGKTG